LTKLSANTGAANRHALSISNRGARDKVERDLIASFSWLDVRIALPRFALESRTAGTHVAGRFRLAGNALSAVPRNRHARRKMTT